jgi:predicted metal-dependent phosphoesterase TrpH
MTIDLHIHSNNSDGVLSVEEITREATLRKIKLLSITDHDSIVCQNAAQLSAEAAGVNYLVGVELNVTYSHSRFHEGKSTSLDFLGYRFDADSRELIEKLKKMADYREERASKILANLNAEFEKERIEKLTRKDFKAIQDSVDGVLGRPHIADYLVKKGIVKNRQEAFDRYLVKCDVPKYPLSLEEASRLIRNAGGILVLAHPNDPHGTSLVTLTKSLSEQTQIIEESMMSYIDGVECWHSRNTPQTTDHYIQFSRKHGLIMTGGSDCHQKPMVMGAVKVPDFVAEQFGIF